MLSGSAAPASTMLVETDGFYAPFFVRTLCDYSPPEPHMLAFRRGEIIQVLAQMESGWWDGVLDRCVRGWFPSNYVELVSDTQAAECREQRAAEAQHVLPRIEAAQRALEMLAEHVRRTVPEENPVDNKYAEAVALYMQSTANLVYEIHMLTTAVEQHPQSAPATYTDVLVREMHDILALIVLLMRELTKKLHWSLELALPFQQLCLSYTSEQRSLCHYAMRLHSILEAFSPLCPNPDVARVGHESAALSIPRLGLSTTSINLLAGSLACETRTNIDMVEPLLAQLRTAFEPLYAVLCGEDGVFECGDAWVGALRHVLELLCRTLSTLYSCDLAGPLNRLLRERLPPHELAPVQAAFGECAIAQNDALAAAQSLYLTAQSVLLYSAHRPGDSALVRSLLPGARAFESKVHALDTACMQYISHVRRPGSPDCGAPARRTPDDRARLSFATTSSSPERSSSISCHTGEALTLPLTEPPPFLACDIEPDELVYSSTGRIRGGTLPALVAYLTKHDAYDATFTATFLTTFKTFTTTDEFLRLVMQRYRITPPPGLTPEQHTVWTERKQRPTRLRAFNIIKVWLETYFDPGHDETHLALVEHFADTDLADETSQRKQELIRRLVYRRLRGQPIMSRIASVTSAPPEPLLPRNLRRIQILDIDPLEWARQLTVQENRLFNNIRTIECLKKAWANADAGVHAQGIVGSIAFYNKITSWVQRSLLEQKGVQVRAQCLRHFVLIARQCLLLNNFASMWAIVSSLSLSSLYRLRNTWHHAGRATEAEFDRLEEITRADRNYATYRKLLHNVNPPCVPFFGIYAKDLTFVEDGNTDMLPCNPALINFAKRQRISEIVRELHAFQSTYNIKEVPELTEYLNTHLVYHMSDHEYYALSLKLEPRLRTAPNDQFSIVSESAGSSTS